MPTYTMRHAWPGENRPNDYVFRVNGKDSGRCYLSTASGAREVWLWTVYGRHARGMEDTLEQAQRRFKEATASSFSS